MRDVLSIGMFSFGAIPFSAGHARVDCARRDRDGLMRVAAGSWLFSFLRPWRFAAALVRLHSGRRILY
jgi:hypothetical protein